MNSRILTVIMIAGFAGLSSVFVWVFSDNTKKTEITKTEGWKPICTLPTGKVIYAKRIEDRRITLYVVDSGNFAQDFYLVPDGATAPAMKER